METKKVEGSGLIMRNCRALMMAFWLAWAMECDFQGVELP